MVECLRKSEQVAITFEDTPVLKAQLLVELVNGYIYFYEQGNEEVSYCVLCNNCKLCVCQKERLYQSATLQVDNVASLLHAIYAYICCVLSIHRLKQNVNASKILIFGFIVLCLAVHMQCFFKCLVSILLLKLMLKNL